MKLLIEYGADPFFKDYYGFTPFDRLKKNKQNSIVKKENKKKKKFVKKNF
jgi:ankyrin repeat protein